MLSRSRCSRFVLVRLGAAFGAYQHVLAIRLRSVQTLCCYAQGAWLVGQWLVFAWVLRSSPDVRFLLCVLAGHLDQQLMIRIARTIAMKSGGSRFTGVPAVDYKDSTLCSR